MLLYHLDLKRVGQRATLGDWAPGRSVCLGATSPHFGRDSEDVGLPLQADDLQSEELRFDLSEPGWLTLEAGSQRLRYTVNGRPGTGSERISPEELRRGVLLGLQDHTLVMLGLFSPQFKGGNLHGLVGVSEAIERTRAEISELARIEMPILIRGETGAGKERIAWALHAAGRRASKPFVAINMAAISPSSAASELFGHRRGSFTDAVSDHQGYFGAADGGTLFMDEVGETPLAVQTLLLRALDEGQIQPVGGTPRRVDVRLLTATDSDLEQKVSQGLFREALLHRIGVCSIDIPPLRQRREGIPSLLLHFVRHQLAALDAVDRLLPPASGKEPWLSRDLMAELVGLDWPGNVRQLRNVAVEMAARSAGAERAVIPPSLHRVRPRRRPSSGGIAPEPAVVVSPAASDKRKRHVVPHRDGTALTAKPEFANTVDRPASADDAQIKAALAEHRWNLSGAARALGMAKSTLIKRMATIPGVRSSVDLSAADIAEARAAVGSELPALSQFLQVGERALAHRIRELERLAGE